MTHFKPVTAKWKASTTTSFNERPVRGVIGCTCCYRGDEKIREGRITAGSILVDERGSLRQELLIDISIATTS